MNQKKMIVLIIGAGVSAVALSLAMASAWAAGGDATQAPVAAASIPVSGEISYQGRLLDSSNKPVNGISTLTFRLYETDSGGSELWDFATGVEAINGFFSINLPVDPALFDGRQLWLGVQVQGEAEMTPRQPILTVPYAHSLQPGAVISATLDSFTSSGGLLGLVNSDASSNGGYALKAVNYSGNTWRPAIYGENNGASAGVYGRSDGWHAVVGWNVSDNWAGVWGNNTGTGSGVRGDSTNGYGGYFASSAGLGVYSEGNAHVEGELSWKPVTSYLSIPASDFQPIQDGYDYLIDTTAIYNNDGNSDYFIAPVHLPHGAIVTKLTFYWRDNSPSNGSLTMFFNNFQLTQSAMATVSTNGQSTTPSSSQDTSITYGQIDNSQRTYYLWLVLPDNLVIATGAVIEYTVTGPN